MLRMTDWQVELFPFLGEKKFPGSCSLYLQRALKAPEREKSQNWLLADDHKLHDREKGEGKRKREIEAVMQNVRITTKEDDCKTGLRIHRKLATQQKTQAFDRRSRGWRTSTPIKMGSATAACQERSVTSTMWTAFPKKDVMLTEFLWTYYSFSIMLHMSWYMLFQEKTSYISIIHIHVTINSICILILILIYS